MSGDIYTGQSFTSDQYSQIQVTSTPLSGTQWIGPAVRAQNNGQNLYIGLYWWNSGNPELMLFKRINGAWTQLGSTYASWAPGRRHHAEADRGGSTLTFSENGTAAITATDTSLTGGAPRHHGLRHRQRRQLGGRQRRSEHLLGGRQPSAACPAPWSSQDNGGDTLNVSANGTFTFATLLAHGASYHVTRDQPHRPDLHRQQRIRHRRRGQRHQRHRHLHRRGD